MGIRMNLEDGPGCWQRFVGTDGYEHFCDREKHIGGYCFCVLHGGVKAKNPKRELETKHE